MHTINVPQLRSSLDKDINISFILGVLFSDSILAWQADPMVINLAETGLPVRNLDFPAVTVCRDEKDDVTDRWYFIEAVMNVLDMFCEKGKYSPLIHSWHRFLIYKYYFNEIFVLIF